MFAILIDDVMDDVLQAFDTDGIAGNELTESEFLDAVQTDGDPYIDWVSGIDEGATDLGSLGTLGDANFALLGDRLHPNELGYAIMGEVFTQGLFKARVIPEPTSLALLGIGAAALLARRPR